MQKILPEKLFPTPRAVPGHRMRIVATLGWPISGWITGTPVLVRKLTAPQRERRAEAAALQAKQTELAAAAEAEAEAAFTKKLNDEPDADKRAAMVRAQETKKVTVHQVRLEQAKAASKIKRAKFWEVAAGAAITLVVGGPLIWSLARPLIEPGIGLLLGGWWIAALIHAPAKKKGEEEKEGESSAEAGTRDAHPAPAYDDLDVADDDQEQPEPTTYPPLSPAELAITVEHMVALRAQSDEGRGHVHLSEVLSSLQRHGHYTEYTTRDFGPVLRAAGLTTEKSIRVPTKDPKKAVSTGFSAAGLTTHLGRPPRLPPQAVIDRTPEAV
ncbi:hypothetical protein ACFVUY_42330 [Kitasatospora sp. NPDC058063]|uniref:hypothetical protein n=1 Tax=unclassified Kitasatospora TaxID=2633591 RepID=UPI0036D876D4